MKQNHTRAFFIETAFLTLFVLLALTVLVQVFGRARTMGEQAARTSAAALILQNVDADFQAGAREFDVMNDPHAQAQTLEMYYDADGEAAADGAYLVSVTLTPMSATGNGRLWTAEITVSDADRTAQYAAGSTACYYKKGAA